MEDIGRKNKQKIVLIFIFSIFLGCFLELLCVFRFDILKKIQETDTKHNTVTLDQMQYINCEKQGMSKIVTLNNDAQLVIQDLDLYVGYVEVELEKPVEHSWQLQIFFCTDGAAFESENCITRWVSKYEKKIFLEVNREVDKLRIDLGEEPDMEFAMKAVRINPTVCEYLWVVLNQLSGVKILIYVILICLIGVYSFWKSETIEFLYLHRWLVGGMVIIFCTFFKIHGSSVSYYADALPGYDYGELWGQYRRIRSDEYVVSTQIALSQVKGEFPWFSDYYRYSPTDMLVVGSQPIKSFISVLYRPFQVGYLLFGAERGLAFYWSARMVCCFLASFEFGRIITKYKRKLSVAYALLISMSPVVQWFFSAGGLIEILVFGQIAIVLFKRYLSQDILKYKIMYMIGMVMCAGGYILSLYPAFEVAFFYVFLACAIVILVENRKHIKIRISDIVLWFLGISILIVSLAYSFYKSWDAVESLMNTVYPGNRTITGGTVSDFGKLFQGWSSIFWSFIEIDNPCEVSSFVDFFPLGIVLSLAVFIIQKKKDIWIITLNVFNFIMVSFVMFQWPQQLAKITLFDNIPIQRMIVAVGFLNLMLLIRCMAVGNVSRFFRYFAHIVLIIVICVFSLYCTGTYLNALLKGLIICCVCLAVIIITNVNKRGKWENQFLDFCIVISIFGGGLVNPINRGLDVLYDNPMIRNIEKIDERNKGMWMVDTDNFVHNNLPAVVGAKVVNSVQLYPDNKMWEKIGLKDEDDIWNRYAHLNIRIMPDKQFKNRLELIQGDYMRLSVNLDTVKEIGINYILSNQDMQYVSCLDCLYTCGGLYIYELN